MDPLLENAVLLAVRAHDGQLRKEAAIPYIVHPFSVALILARHGFGSDIIAAGLLHDVLEDTDFTEDDIKTATNADVLAMVKAVTNDDVLSWEDKKKKYIETVRAGAESAKAVATADKIHNAESLLAAAATQGTSVWKHFNAGREKKLWFENAMLAMLRETWHHPLVDEYAALVERINSLS